MLSSIRKIVTAASTANDKLLILLIAGSNTPACRLSRTHPSFKSSPVQRSESLSACEVSFKMALKCCARSALIKSTASHAELTASYLGIDSNALAKAVTANYSFPGIVFANSSRYTDKAASTQPPPGTTKRDSKALETAHNASCTERSTSSRSY